MFRGALLLVALLCMQPLVASDPVLEGRRHGVEFNFARLLLVTSAVKSASGTFSWFDHAGRVEIAMPWTIDLVTDDYMDGRREHRDEYDLDLHYRKFLGASLGGFYLSGFVRTTLLNGLRKGGDGYKKRWKTGAGVGIGYRYFPTHARYYWGMGLIVGRYLVGKNNIYDEGGPLFNDAPEIIDLELLKFGYAF